MQVRQGDVFLERVDALPDQRRKLAPRGSRIVLADGELTGHAHTLPASAGALYAPEAEGDTYLQLRRPALLRHQEHDPIELPAGTYRVRRQREYSPEEIRSVAD